MRIVCQWSAPRRELIQVVSLLFCVPTSRADTERACQRRWRNPKNVREDSGPTGASCTVTYLSHQCQNERFRKGVRHRSSKVTRGVRTGRPRDLLITVTVLYCKLGLEVFAWQLIESFRPSPGTKHPSLTPGLIRRAAQSDCSIGL